MCFKPRADSVSSPLPNFAQLALGSGQRLQSDEVITYRHAVGIHLHQENTQRGQEEEHTHTDTRRGQISSTKPTFRISLLHTKTETGQTLEQKQQTSHRIGKGRFHFF